MGNSVSHCEPEIVAVRDEASKQQRDTREERRRSLSLRLRGKKPRRRRKQLDCGGAEEENDSSSATLLPLARGFSPPFSRRQQTQNDVLLSFCGVECRAEQQNVARGRGISRVFASFLRRRPFFFLLHALLAFSPSSSARSLFFHLPLSSPESTLERDSLVCASGEFDECETGRESVRLNEREENALEFFFLPPSCLLDLNLFSKKKLFRPPPSRPSRTPSKLSRTLSPTPSRTKRMLLPPPWLKKQPRRRKRPPPPLPRSRSRPRRTTRASRRPTSRGTATRATTSTTDVWRRRAKRTRSANS